MTRADRAAAATIAVAALICTAPLLASRAARDEPHCLDLAALPHHGMVRVPGGTFEEGDTVYPEEGPVTHAQVKPFWIDAHEVTNSEFAAFVAATGYVTTAERPLDPATHPGLAPDLLKPGAMVFVVPKEVHGMENIAQWWRYVPGADWRHPAGPGSDIDGRENYPVVAVTQGDALAYARWKHRDLPTEAEWVRAARAGHKGAGDDHDQPKNANTWQGIFPVLNSGDDGFVGLAPAGCYAPNAYGIYDMFGNVWELTKDIFTAHPGDAPDPLPMPSRGEAVAYTIKGGSFLCAPNYCMRYRSGSREPQEADLASSHLGFRTVLREGQP